MFKQAWVSGLIALFACTGNLEFGPAGASGSGPGEGSGGDSTSNRADGGATNDGPDGVGPSACGALEQGSPARRLNRAELANAIEDVFGAVVPELFDALPPDGTLGGFATVGTQLSSGALFTNAYVELAERIADRLVSEGKVAYACAQDEVSNSCFEQTLLPYARRLYRGASTADVALAADAAGKVAAQLSITDGLRAGLAAMLASPRFLFVLPEADADVARALTPTELATRLSLSLWLSLPDDQLLARAADGSLTDTEVLESELARMLDDARFKRFVRGFFSQSLTLDRLKTSGVDAQAFGLEPDELSLLLADMGEETLRFVEHIWDENLPADALLSSRTSFVNDRLARHYGLSARPGATHVRVDFDPSDDRRGLLTQGAVLTQAASGSRASVVLRGDLVLAGLLCQPPPPPPASFEEAIEELTNSGASEREKLEVRAARPECAGCHSSMDPIGWALSGFDPLGRRATAGPGGESLDPSTTLDGKAVRGASELADVLLARDRVSACLSEKLLIYGTGRRFDPSRREDRCVIEEMVGRAREGGTGSLPDMVRALVLTPAFRLQGTVLDT